MPNVYCLPCAAEIHMKYKLRMSEQQVVDNAVNAVKHLRSLGCTDIEFSPEDAGGCWWWVLAVGAGGGCWRWVLAGAGGCWWVQGFDRMPGRVDQL